MPNTDMLKANFDAFHSLVEAGKVTAAYTIAAKLEQPFAGDVAVFDKRLKFSHIVVFDKFAATLVKTESIIVFKRKILFNADHIFVMF